MWNFPKQKLPIPLFNFLSPLALATPSLLSAPSDRAATSYTITPPYLFFPCPLNFQVFLKEEI